MPFIKFFISSILLIFSLILSKQAVAVNQSRCGDYIFQVKILNGSNLLERRFELYYKLNGHKKKLFYKTERDIGIYTTCVKDKKGRAFMLFLEFSGGNAGPEDIYGVFDPDKNSMLIRPADWPKGNSKQVKKLIGSPPPYAVGDGKTFFCCFKRQYDRHMRDTFMKNEHLSDVYLVFK